MIRRFLAASILALGFGGVCFSQDSSFDQLFEEPQADIEATPIDATPLPAAFVAQGLTVTGSLSASAGAVAGFVDSGNGFIFDVMPGISVVPGLSFIARPDPSFRMQGTVSFPSMAFAPSVDEMFFDYTLLDYLYFRIGKHRVSWAATRLFDAGGDLMSPSGTGLNVKATLPLGPGGITAIALVPLSPSSPSYRDLTYGAQGDLSFGRTEFVLSGTYLDRDSTPAHATAVVKATLFGVDVFAEGVGSWTRGASPALAGLVAGFYYELIEHEVKLYGEYYFNSSNSSSRDHRIALVAGKDRIFGSPFDVGLEWVHAFQDNSGILIPAATINPWPHVSIQIGFPCRYGAAGSFFLANQPPSVASAANASEVLTWSQRYGILLRVSLSAGF